MKIYTRTGDQGETSLLKGGRVPKYDLRVQTYGTFDELNSWIGYVRALNPDPEVEAALARLQPELHALCSDVAARREPDETPNPYLPRTRPDQVEALEREIDRMDGDLETLTHFILPGGSPAGAALHVTRTVSRRAERLLVELAQTEGAVNPEAVRYANRLSDYLFTLARWANHRAGRRETAWVGSQV
ncbi:MAG: cob(I)yrinic acid a,c-diamide adenosyltransferase [Candidatus Zixiibacteriota bacterium]|nr:MAG: cob(I)yrinic acid a,c-diamide adenosyltransferase [candidate division Zixibacteria bacterium]